MQINITSNLAEVLKRMTGTIENEIVNSTNTIMLTAATGVLSLVAYRIHTAGEKANGTPIGTYSPAYYKYRQGKPFNRTDSTSIVFSLTRQMENDFSPVDIGSRVGLGFKNSHNYDKANYLEERFKGVYTLSAEEATEVVAVINDYINGVFA